MSLIRFQQPQIVVEIADLTIGSTVIKRKARFDSLVYSQLAIPTPPMFKQPGGDSPETVTVNLTIQFFAKNEDDSYGEPLDGKPGFSSYSFPLIANNTTLVDATTGDVVGTAAEYEVVANVVEGGKFFGKSLMYENEFFRNMAMNVEVKVDEVIEQYILKASQAGRFNQ